jgi:hypothetical protein
MVLGTGQPFGEKKYILAHTACSYISAKKIVSVTQEAEIRRIVV